ncbi:hypothetical protein JCM8097_000766 [Rhodosporidiobolus ruineniae]
MRRTCLLPAALVALATLAVSAPPPLRRQGASTYTRLAQRGDDGRRDGGEHLGRRDETDETAQQDEPAPPAHLPFVAAPWGDFFLSAPDGSIVCEDLKLSFGGGAGPPYAIAIVNASTINPDPAANQTVDDVEVIERVGILGMPGMTWWSMQESDLGVGEYVALQVVDGEGQVGYSASRHVSKGHLNEYCHYPGAFWPPSRWDSSHFIMLLVFAILVVPFSTALYSEFKKQLAASRVAFRASRAAAAAASTAETVEVPLQDRNTHVLGDDDERTSLEDEDRPLLMSDGTRAELPPTAPPGYDDATKEGWQDELDERDGRRV